MDIFISYRRDDSGAAHAAPRLAEELRRLLSVQVFMDLDNLEPGLDFVSEIERAVSQCMVLIAVIGEEWLQISDAEGKRRLDQPKDWVRVEIGTALARGIRVVPALLDGVAMPKPEDLPPELKALTQRQAIELRTRTFRRDVEYLASVLGRAGRKAPTRRRVFIATLGLIAAAALALTIAARSGPPTPARESRSEATSAQLREALERSSTTAEEFADLGYSLELLGNFADAVIADRRAIELSPQNTRAHWNLGNALYGLGEYEASAESHRAALRISPDYVNAYIGLGNALSKLGKETEARAAFEMGRDPSKRP